MLKTGAEHLETLRDGRVVYLGRERVDDVTTHPAFANGNNRSVVPSHVPHSKFPRPHIYFDKNSQYPNTASLSAIVGGRGVAVDAAIVDLETNKNFSNGRKIADILRYVARLRHEGASNIINSQIGINLNWEIGT